MQDNKTAPAPDPVKARRELHQGLIDLEWYSKSGFEFDQQFLDPHARNELYQGLVKEKMYSKGFEEFSEQFFGDLLKKKEEPVQYGFPGQLDLSQPLSNQLPGGSGNIPKEYQKDYLEPLTYKPGTIPVTPLDPSEQRAEKFLSEMERRDFEQLQRDTELGQTGIKKPFVQELINAPAPVMRAEDAEKNAKAIVKSFQEEITGNIEPQGTITDITEDLKQVPPSFNKGIISVASTIPKGVAILAKKLDDLTGARSEGIEKYSTYQLGQWIEDKAKEIGITAVNDKRAGFMNSTVPMAFGQMMGMMLTGGVGNAQAGLVPQSIARQTVNTLTSPIAISGALQASVPEYEAAKAAGKSDEEAFGVFLKNIPGGMTEVIPIANMFSKLNKITGNGLLNALKLGTAQGLEEGSQEAVQQYLTNKIAQGTYDPKRDLKEGLLEGAGAGFIVGFLMPGVMGAMDSMTPDQKNETRAIIDEILKKPKEDEKPKEQTGSVAAVEVPKAKTQESVPVQGEQEVKGEEVVKGNDVWESANKAGSEHNDALETYEKQIRKTDYKLVDVPVSTVIKNDGDVKSMLEKDVDFTAGEFSKKRKITQPIIIGEVNRGGDNFKMGVVDGGNRIAQAVANGDQTIQAYVPVDLVDDYLKPKQDAIQEPSPEKVSVEKPAPVSPQVGEEVSGEEKTAGETEKEEVTYIKQELDGRVLYEDIDGNKYEARPTRKNGYYDIYKNGKKLDSGAAKFSDIQPVIEQDRESEKRVEDFKKEQDTKGYDVDNLIKNLKRAFEKPLPEGMTGFQAHFTPEGLRTEIRKENGKFNYYLTGQNDKGEKVKVSKKQIASFDNEVDAVKYAIAEREKYNKAKYDQPKEETFGKFKVIGVNSEGNKVGEDKNGVRGVLKGSVIVSQPVGVIPGQGISVSSPEGQFMTKEESKSQADKIAKDAGFDNASHLINSVKKRTGQEFENVQDIPKEVIEETVKSRKEEKPKITQIKEANPERILVVKPTPDKPRKSDAKFEKARNSAAELLDLIGPGLKINEEYDPIKAQKIILKAGEVVANYIDAGVTRFAEMVQDILETYGEQAARVLFDPMKKGYGSQLASVPDEIAEKMDDIKTIRASKIEDFIQEEEEPAEEQEKLPKSTFVAHIKNVLGTEKLDKRKIESIGEQHGITDKNEVKELVELAIVSKARELSQEDDFKGLIELYENQPTLSHRTNESISKQQYSTPAPIAYLMGKYLNLDKVTSALEPSAGNGMLTIVADPKVFTVNEIDPVRLANLKKQGFGEVLEQDGRESFDRDKQYNAVVTNPPFGGTEEVKFDGYKLNELAQIMSANALEAMKDNGKAAIIIGGNNKFDESGRLTGRDAIYFNYLFNKYNVEDIIDVDGDIYRKQGASFPIRIILINGRKTEANKDFAPRKEWFGKQEDSFEGIQERINKHQGYENIQPSELVGGPTEVTGGRGSGVSQQTESGTTENVSGESVRKPGKKDGGSKSGTVRGGNVGGRAGQQSGVDSGSNTGESTVSETTGGEGYPQSTKLNQPERTQENTGKRAAKREREATAGSSTGESTVEYKPVSGSGSLNVSTPAALQQQMSDALTDLVNEVGDVDQFVIEKLGYKDKKELHKALAAEQVDGVALAIRNVERGTGIIIGDQPGIGKGRQAAAMVRYALEQGLVPIFFTKNPSLFSDIYRDLNDVGLGNIKPFILNAKDASKFPAIYDRQGNVLFTPAAATSVDHRNVIRTGKVPDGTKIILASYSQFANQTGGPTREKTEFIQRKSQGTLLIMDESHLASGEESNTSAVFMSAVQNAKGVVFLSGTYAKRASNMPLYALKTSMKEAQVESVDSLLEAINSGGAPLQEILAGILTESGEMIRRERTFKGIEVKTHVMGGDDQAVKEKQRKQADSVTGIMRDIVEFQKTYVFPEIKKMDDEIKGGRVRTRRGTNLGSVKGSPYFQKVFNVINQLLYAIKAEETANLIIAEHKAGRKPFLAIRATMESMLKDMIQRGEMNVGDPFNNDFSFVLKKGLEGTTRITVEDAQGNKVKTTIPISQFSAAAQAHYKYLMQKIKGLKTGLSISPIDVIVEKLEAAGLRVGEVTGRQYKIVTENGIQYLKPNKKLNQTKSYQKYNNGDLDVLIVNRSGSTGVSAHSSKDVKDQTPRTMFVLESELDISELVQMLFRVNRSGQVNLPKYVFVSSTIPAEQRLINMSTSKLKSLDAQTTSNQKQSSSLMGSVDIFNKYGDQVVLEYLKDNPEINAEIGNPIASSLNQAGEEVAEKDAAHKATGKIAILSTDKQEHFYNEVTERYQKQIQFLNEAGINDLVIETLPLKAKTLSKETLIIGKGGRSRFGDDTYIEEVEVNTLKKPMTKAEIDHQIKQLEINKDVLLGRLEEYRTKRIDKINKDVDEKYRPKYEAIQKDNASSPEDKQKAIEELKADEEFFRNGKVTAEESRIFFIKTLINFFNPGDAVLFPSDLSDIQNSGSRPAIFLGFDVNVESEKAFLPSNVSLKFAINDSRRSIGIAASKDVIVNNIRNSSAQLSPTYKKDTYENWDQLKKPKDRVKRYMATGNILQALTDPRVNKGKIVKYDTEDGFTVTGVLQSEDFNPAETSTGKIKIPASKAEYIIRNSDKFVLNEEKTIGIKPTNGRFEVRVPLAKQSGGKYYLDDELTNIVINGRWDSIANTMQAFVEDDQLKEFLDVLGNKFGVSFSVDRSSLEPDPDQPKTKSGGKPQPTPDSATGKAGKPKNKNVKPFNMADRIKEIFKKNGIPINEGYLRKTYNGVYKHMIDGVRVQSLWDLFVASHEMTHAIDKKYKIFEDIQSRGSKKLHDELIHAYENLYPSPKKTATLKERIQEGLAMALEYYVAEPQMVNQDYPEIIKQVFDENGMFYQDQMGQFIKDMEQILHDYQSLNPEDKINARIKWTGTKKKGGVSTWVKANHMLTNDMITGNMVDQMMGGELRSNAITPNVSMLRNIASITSNWIKQPFGVKEPPQTYIGNGNWAPTKSKYRVNDYLQKLETPKNIMVFNSWLVARRQYFDYLKLEFLEDEINNNGRTDLVDRYNQLSKIVENNKMPKDLAESAYNKFAKQFDSIAEIYDAINRDMVDFMESTGLISMDQANEYRNEKGYASFQRFLEDETSPEKSLTLSSGAKSTLNSLRTRSGSDRQVLPPTYSQLVAIGETLRRGQLNLVWKAWADAAKQNKEIARYFEPVSIQDIPAGNKDFQPVWDNGERKFYKLGEEAKMFAQALTPDQVDMFNAYLRGSSRLFQALTTQLYAPFAIMNLSLDATTRFMHTQTGLIPIIHDVKTIGDAMKGLGSWMGILNSKLGSNEFTHYLALGGRKQTLAGTLSLEPLSATERILNKDWVSRGKRGWEKAIMVAEMPVNMTELIGRATEFRRAIKQGHPTNVAMMLAANVAVNFSNNGSLANNYVKSVSYMGAGIQAFTQAIKSAKKNPLRMASAIGIMATLAASGALAVYMLGDDDEKRQLANMEPEEYAKFIFIPGSLFGMKPQLIAIRIPETGGNIAAAAQLYFSHLYMNRPLLFSDLYKSQEAALPAQLHVSQGLNVYGSWLPQAISPEIQVITNTRFYPHAMPIVPEWMADLDEYAQYDKYTSRTARALGELTRDELIEISPKKFDFYERAKFGRTITLIHSLAEAALYNEKPRSYINIFQESDRFMFTGRVYNKFYELRKEAKQEYTAVKSQAPIFNLPASQVDEAKARMDEYEYLHKEIQYLRDKIDNNINVSDAEKKAIFDKLMVLTKDELEK